MWKNDCGSELSDYSVAPSRVTARSWPFSCLELHYRVSPVPLVRNIGTVTLGLFIMLYWHLLNRKSVLCS